MEDHTHLDDAATFIQEGRALRRICKGTRSEEPVFSNIFTWISHELFNDIEVMPIALRHAIQKHIFKKRRDIMDILLTLLTDPANTAKKLKEHTKKLSNQIIDPTHDAENCIIYLYCLATFLDVNIYVLTLEDSEFKWHEFKSLKLLSIEQEIKYQNITRSFQFERVGHPGFLMSYFHMESKNDMNIYPISPAVEKPEEPHCIGLLEQHARQLKRTQLDDITIPASLAADVHRNAAKLPLVERLRYWIEEYCQATDSGPFGQKTIEITEPSHRYTTPCSIDKCHEEFVKHLSRSDRDHVLVFCRILVRRCEFTILRELCANFDHFDMPIRRKYDALNRLEKAQRQFNNALEIGSCPTELHERRRRVNSAVIGTSITGLVGGVLGIVGLILIPFTLGASLGLTITGGVIGGASSIVQGGFRVHEAVQQNCSLSEIKEGLEKVQEELQQALTDFASQFDSHAFGDRGPESPGWSIKGTMTFGSVFRVAHSIAGIILAAVKVGATLATVIASIFGPISVLLDGSFLVEAIYDKITGDHTQAGKKLECLRAFQTVLQTTFRGNEDFSICIVENTMQTK